jgi:hypothetical protein
MMKLTEQEKSQLRLSVSQTEQAAATRGRVLPMAEYFKQLEQYARIMPKPEKPVAFEGKAWRL